MQISSLSLPVLIQDFLWVKFAMLISLMDESQQAKASKSVFNPLTPRIFSESRVREFQPRLPAQATCQTAHSRYVALRALHALLYTVKRLIVRGMRLYSCF
jgi:hypothetical protein